MKLYLIRHGETDWNKEMRMQGRSDIPLNEYGVSLAEQTAEALKGVPFDLVYTSPLTRAKETAEVMKADRCIPVVEDERIIEIGFGEFEGHLFFTDKERINPEPLFVDFFKAPGAFRALPGGESFADVVRRTGDFLDEVIHDDELQDKTILVSTHGAALCGMLTNLKQTPIDRFWGEGVHKNCAVSIVDIEEGQPEIVQEAVVYYDEKPSS